MANVQYRGVFFGREQAGKAVTVVNAKTNANAVLTSDRNGANSLANPVTVAADGVVSFFAPEGKYRLTGNGQTQDINLRGDSSAGPEIISTITGSRGTQTASVLQQLLSNMAARGIITDNTTA